MAFSKYVYRPKDKEIWGREIEYIMPKEMFDKIAATRAKSGKGRMDAFKYVMEYVNESFGLLGTVTALSVEGEKYREQKAYELDPAFA